MSVKSPAFLSFMGSSLQDRGLLSRNARAAVSMYTAQTVSSVMLPDIRFVKGDKLECN